MLTLTQLEALRPELDAWNAAIRRSAAEYAAHPRVACGGWLIDPEGVETPCTNVRNHNDRLCKPCRKAAAKRRRAGGVLC